MNHCYATAAVEGAGGAEHLGGFCGSDSGSITNCFWDTNRSGWISSAGAVGITTKQMQTQSTFVDGGWDFVHEAANGTNDLWIMADDPEFSRNVPLRFNVSLDPGTFGTIVEATFETNYTVTVAEGALCPGVNVTAMPGYCFSGWNPCLPARISSHVESVAQYRVDLDGDNLPDEEEQRIIDAFADDAFGSLADIDGSGDFDSDGRSDAQEMVDGTDSTDAGSTLDLVTFYPLDGNATDYSTHGYHATTTDTEPTTDRFGRAGRALDFGKTYLAEDEVQGQKVVRKLGNVKMPSFSLGEECSLVAWVNLNEDSYVSRLFKFSDADNQQAFPWKSGQAKATASSFLT